jgi:predicted RNA binding protein YcfA (HicA-like mRNA interferase family)
MSEKLPVVSGKELLKMLHSLGYIAIRQRGSHIRLEKKTPAGIHKITIVDHKEIAKGTLNDILDKVSLWTQMSKKELINKLK